MAARREPAGAVSQTEPDRRVVTTPSGPETLNRPVTVEVAQGRKARRAGKRSDPAFRPTTIFVRKETQRKATRLLEDQDMGRDFSDLVEELVANWVTENTFS